jgi:hypothetical protein
MEEFEISSRSDKEAAHVQQILEILEILRAASPCPPLCVLKSIFVHVQQPRTQSEYSLFPVHTTSAAIKFILEFTKIFQTLYRSRSIPREPEIGTGFMNCVITPTLIYTSYL